MTTLWQAEPELSLTDRDSTVVRAFFESLFIAEWSRTVDAFPGFADLIAASDTRVSETDPDRDHPWSGTRRLLLRSVAVSGDEVRVDRGFDAPWQPGTTCDKWAQQNYPGVIDPGPPAKRMYPNGFPDPAFQPTLEQSPGWTRIGQP
ncbi:hypothetical protein G3I13_21210 [Streptomyces sp. SID6673]|nr:hypothetical protein [Streptomyces sp. SID11726]NEB26859.1 hypothetical protein [Streptomyces sp. SID6673]